MEQALYAWFLQQRSHHIPVSSEILRTKAKFFYEHITGKTDFVASSGWLQKFKARHGIRLLKVCGEKISSDSDSVRPFQERFLKVVEEMKLSATQVYNADESASFWRVLPGSTWVHEGEKSAPGRKVSKNRLTFMPCCNATGTHKLPLLVIGKANKPRCFKNAQIPVVYKASGKGWMSRNIFLDWFNNHFIPDVKRFQKETGETSTPKALLLLDNAPSHPKEEDVNIHPHFKILYLPPNCTAILQPMDQNLIQNLKVSYRKSLLNHIIAQDDGDIMKLLKNFTLKDATHYLDQAWRSISKRNIQKSWSALWPDQTIEWEEEDELPLSDLRKRLQSDSVNTDLQAIKKSLHILEPRNNLTDKEITSWATGKDEPYVEDQSETEIIEAVINKNEGGDSESDTEEDSRPKIKHSDAANSLSISIQWAEENNLPLQDILLLKKIKETVTCILQKKTVQKKIDNFFLKK